MADGSRRIDPAFTAEVKRRISLAELIGGSGLVDRWKLGRTGEFRGICPFHSERSPSFYVVEDKGFWHCFGCGMHGDAVGWVMRTTNAKDFPEALEYLAARVGMSRTGPSLDAKPVVRRPSDEMRAEADGKRIAAARQIWAAAREADERSPVARYLRESRRIRLPIPPTVRFHPALEHPHLRYRGGFPAMVAPVVSLDRKIVGVHCTYLARDGAGKMPAPVGWPPRGMDPDEKWKPKIMRGVVWRGAIRLTPAEPVMIVAEGIETALSVLQALADDETGIAHIDGEPVGVWAAGSLGNMGAIALPDGVREVILAADGDGKVPDVDLTGADQPGRTDPETLIEAAALRHRHCGRNVRIARPPSGMDFNDMVPQGAGATHEADDERLGEAAA